MTQSVFESNALPTTTAPSTSSISTVASASDRPVKLSRLDTALGVTASAAAKITSLVHIVQELRLKGGMAYPADLDLLRAELVKVAKALDLHVSKDSESEYNKDRPNISADGQVIPTEDEKFRAGQVASTEPIVSRVSPVSNVAPVASNDNSGTVANSGDNTTVSSGSEGFGRGE